MFLKDILIDSSDKIVDRKMTVDVFVDNPKVKYKYY